MPHVEELLKAGDRRTARAIVEKVIAKTPDDLGALHMLSTIDIEEGKIGLAYEKIEKVLAADPEHAPATYNKGICQLQRGEQARALETFRKTLSLDPRHSGALYNVAFIQRSQGHIDQSTKTFEHLLKINPNWMSARDAYCDTLFIQGRFDDILAVCAEPIQHGKATSATFRARAGALRAMGRLQEAEEAYRQSLQLNASDPVALHGFGGLLQDVGRFADALVVYEREAVIAGKEAVYADRFDPALTEIIRSSRHICKWDNLSFYEEQAQKRVRDNNGRADPLLTLAMTDDPQYQQTVARRTWPQQKFDLAQKPVQSTGAKLRVGYLFGPFVTQRLAAVAESHDKNRIETFGYNVAVPGVNERVQSAFANYRDLTNQTNERIAEAIAHDNLDILVDVMGHAVSARLAALLYKAAPLTAHFLSFQGSLGTKSVDYVIADEVAIRPGEEGQYDHAPLRLPGSCRPFDTTRRRAKALKRADVGLKDGQFVFCAFAEPMLLNPGLFDTYANILKDTPNSVLWLADFGETVRTNLRKEATARGLDADRLVFSEGAPGDELLDRLALADAFLDTWPYTGHQIMADALWAGVPAVTRTGRSFTSRLGASMLTAAGLGDLVAADAAGFQRIAVELAKSPERLAAHRARLTGNTNPLFDTRRFTVNLERALEWAVERQRKGQAPAPHTVPAPH
jgi:predicted O-linked N-acetylglucosamine transferase (SPINDLY family)